MKDIGKPCTGKPYARFDEGGQVNVAMTKLLMHRQTKGAATVRFDLRCGNKPAFYSTLCVFDAVLGQLNYKVKPVHES